MSEELQWELKQSHRHDGKGHPECQLFSKVANTTKDGEREDRMVVGLGGVAVTMTPTR